MPEVEESVFESVFFAADPESCWTIGEDGVVEILMAHMQMPGFYRLTIRFDDQHHNAGVEDLRFMVSPANVIFKLTEPKKVKQQEPPRLIIPTDRLPHGRN